MNNKITNPYLKQLLSEISNNANKNRLSDLSWEAIYEARKKKGVKKEQDEKKKDAPAEKGGDDLSTGADKNVNAEKDTGADAGMETGGDLPKLGGADEKPDDTKAPEGEPSEPPASDPESGGDQDADKAKEDAVKAKAELEKAKAEKDKAKTAIKNQSYIKLTSSEGTQYLINKVLNSALIQGGTIDALASDMVQKLNIKTQENLNNFSEDLAPYMSIQGMPDLISSMKNLVTKSSQEDPSN